LLADRQDLFQVPIEVDGPDGQAHAPRLVAFENGKPGLGPVSLPDLEGGRRDGAHLPAGGEGGAKLGLRDPAGTAVARLVFAEAHQQAPPAGYDDALEARYVGRPVLVVENVEEAAIDHRVELPVQLLQAQRIGDREPG